MSNYWVAVTGLWSILEVRTKGGLPSKRLLLPGPTSFLQSAAFSFWQEELPTQLFNFFPFIWASSQPFTMITAAFPISLILMQNCLLKAITEHQEKESVMMKMSISILLLGKAAAEIQQTHLSQHTHRQSQRQHVRSQLQATCSCQTLPFLKSFGNEDSSKGFKCFEVKRDNACWSRV